MPEQPWLNEDGSTNVDGFLQAYAADDNTFWRTDQGHIMNVLDALIDRLDEEEAKYAGAIDQWVMAEQEISRLERERDGDV